VELDQVETFLVLAEELHFGRTAARLYVAQSRVSRLIAALEREVGGPLFERSSRRVELTALGSKLFAELAPAHAAFQQAVRNAQASARGDTAPLRVGFTITTGGYRLNRLLRVFETRHPRWRVMMRELPSENPFKILLAGEIDVLAHWVVEDDVPGLTCGAVIGTSPRALAVAADSPLAAASSLSAEVLGDWPVSNHRPLDDRIRNLIVPLHTPSGRPVKPHPVPSSTISEVISQVARGVYVHPTVASLAQITYGQGIALIPLSDLPPLRIGLYWVAGNTDDRIRALASAAQRSE
jgi:DNA-binding transcriptional LysR family regulator